ncbi:LytR C-terminal domain-containing protein [Streptomyces sp. ISL-111]|nr:LytR C-terminal domain-containing protein [Streptomyces sp. ISL-111]MBT2430372.1 LytR C-terminal domain-containing protein [Streptomyces sp. ISL-112]
MPGQVAKAAETLRAAGYTITGTGYAPESAEETAVIHPEGLARQAGVPASRLLDVATKPDMGVTACRHSHRGCGLRRHSPTRSGGQEKEGRACG